MSDKLIKAQEKAKSCKTYLNYKMISKVSGGYSRNKKILTEEGNSNYILTVIDHFSKYEWVYPLVSKHDESIRDKISSVFIIGHPDILHIDNGKEF